MRSRQAGSVQKQLTAPGSMLGRYKHTVIGDRNWLTLALYECNEFFIQPVRGTIGRRLRAITLPFFLNGLGRNTNIGANTAMRRPGLITLGSAVILAEDITLNVKDDGQAIVLADQVEVGRETVFSCIGGRLSVGRGTKIGRQCRLGSKQGLTIGADCLIGDRTYIVGASHAHTRTDIPIIDQEITCKGPSRIGDHVEIGNNVTLLDGVQIGNHVRIAPGSLVNQNIDNGVHVAGVPARRQHEDN